ncbi:MAG: hypothetical protein IJ644_08270 [Oscillospiraceae bacterium]|nr:hypothetical protein [Oscillospiraceae bacterium]
MIRFFLKSLAFSAVLLYNKIRRCITMNTDFNKPDDQNTETIQNASDEEVKAISDELIQRNLEVYKELAK